VAVAAFLAHSLPLVLIAAVSPVLFLNASRVVEAAGISRVSYLRAGPSSASLLLASRQWV
jgi:hypothetical protein